MPKGSRANQYTESRKALEAERSYLKSQGKSPDIDKKNKRTAISVASRRKITLKGLITTNVDFFRAILSDKVEAEMWMIFMTGQMPKINPDGEYVMEDGKPVMEDVELNPICFKAFQRAVEYKRGLPEAKVQIDNGKDGNKVEITVIGAPKQIEAQTPVETQNIVEMVRTGTGI